jgi:putative MATE family efflux protein
MIIRKDVLRLTLPVVMEQAFVVSLGVINTIMAGRLGKEAVSAIGMVDSINNILISFFSALAIGGTVIVAHYIGQSNTRKANESAKQILYVGVIIALAVTVFVGMFRHSIIRLLFNSADELVISNTMTYLAITLLTYPIIALQLIAFGVLRGAGDTKTPMKINIVTNIVNVILSYFLIYGIHITNEHLNLQLNGMGVKGAAIGIGLARSCGALLIVFVLVRGSGSIKLRKLKSFKPDFTILKSIFGVGVPASVESLLFNGGKLITQVFLVSLGTAAVAANSVAGSISGLFNVPGNAFSIAATTIVGQAMGKGDSEAAKDSLMYMTKLSTVSLALLGIASFPFARFLASLYSNNGDVIAIATDITKLNSICTILWSISFVLPAGLKGAGDAKYTMVTSIVGMWLFRIVMGYVLAINLKFGAIGIWMGMYIDWVVRGILYLIRLKGDKWKKHTVIAKEA